MFRIKARANAGFCYNSGMVIDGKKIGAQILREARIARARVRRPVNLGAVLVGDDDASVHFLRQKEKACRDAGIGFVLRRIPASISRARLSHEVKKMVRDARISGLIVQLPIPKRFGDPGEILDLIPRAKDPDVLGSEALGAFAQGTGLLPPIVGAINYVLRKYRIRPAGKSVVIVGRGRLVGKPAAIWFTNQGSTVTVLNSRTKRLEKYLSDADIVVTGAGKPSLIRGNMLKKGTVVFDVGYALHQGKPAGDADWKSVSRKARFVTPVPGGMGPMGVAMLIWNVVQVVDRHGIKGAVE